VADRSRLRITLTGAWWPLNGGNVTLPPAVDANQKVSIVFTMDYSASVTCCLAASSSPSLISNSMEDGDRLRSSVQRANPVRRRRPVHGGSTCREQRRRRPPLPPTPGDGTNLLRCARASVNQFLQAALPRSIGLKAIILIGRRQRTNRAPP
jgi:hypothetical protein